MYFCQRHTCILKGVHSLRGQLSGSPACCATKLSHCNILVQIPPFDKSLHITQTVHRLNIIEKMPLQPTSPGHNQQPFTKPGRVGAPRLDAYQRLLDRFYEPLFLLKVLGQTRGHHTTVPPDLNLEQARRRVFLRNLAYICDFEKGGSSCTAIGLEDSKSCYKFWVASNTVSGKIVDFLKDALSILQRVACHPSLDLESNKAAFAGFCIEFAASRVKKETKYLFRAVRECQHKLDDSNTEAGVYFPQGCTCVLCY